MSFEQVGSDKEWCELIQHSGSLCSTVEERSKQCSKLYEAEKKYIFSPVGALGHLVKRKYFFL